MTVRTTWRLKAPVARSSAHPWPGIVGLVACGICFLLHGDEYADRFFDSDLIAFMSFWTVDGVARIVDAAASTGLLLGHHDSQTSGVCYRVLSVVAVFFLPIAIFGMSISTETGLRRLPGARDVFRIFNKVTWSAAGLPVSKPARSTIS